MTREEAAVYVWETYEWCMREYENARADKGMMSKTKEAFDVAIAALSEVGSPTTKPGAQHAKKLTSNALAGTDYADRLRWLLAQAERVVTVDAEDRKAVERACKLLKQIDNGFDAVRG